MCHSVCDLGAEIDYNIHDYVVISVKSFQDKNPAVFNHLQLMSYCIIKSKLVMSLFQMENPHVFFHGFSDHCRGG